MTLLLTGATGYIGSSVLSSLLGAGHDVLALVRDERAATAVRSAGARALRGDLADTRLVRQAAEQADGVVHAAYTNDPAGPAVDTAVVDAVLAGLRGSGKPFVYTAGVWLHGSRDTVIDEGTPAAPPALVAWRQPVVERVRAAAADDVRSVVVAPGVVHGRGAGLVRLVVDAPVVDGALLHLGDGSQHWALVHVDDLGPLYLAAVEKAEAGSYYLGVSDERLTVGEMARLASTAAGLGGRVSSEPWTAADERLGLLAEALRLDQRAANEAARSHLGWAPAGPALRDGLIDGTYARADG